MAIPPSEVPEDRRIAERFDRSPWPSRLFVLIALPITMLMAQIIPLGRMPDETAHIYRADSIGNLQLIGRRTSPAAAFLLADPAFEQIGFALPNPQGPRHSLTADILSVQKSAKWTSPQERWAPNTASYSPVMYLPAALGLAVGRATRASPYNSWIVARFFSAAAFVAIGVLALRTAPRWWIFAVLCLPMTLALASSVNPDGLTLAVLALSLALLERGDRRLLAAALMAMAIAQRPALLPLSTLFLLPFNQWRHGSIKFLARRVCEVSVAAIPSILWLALAQARSIVGFVKDPYVPGPLWPGDPNVIFAATDAHAQLKVLLSHPLLLIALPLDTLLKEYWLRGTEAIGVLGALELHLPPRVYVFALCGLLSAALADMTNPARKWPRPLDNVFSLAVLSSGVLFTYLIEYLTWTSVGYPTIDGVQGRYALPLLLAGLFAWPILPRRFARVAPFAAVVATVAIGTVTLMWPESVIQYFYVS
jgi:uncharacterized membrane protein